MSMNAAELAILESQFITESTAEVLMNMRTGPSPRQVAQALRAVGIDFVLVGAQAIGVYTGRPRATIDVDIVCHEPHRAAKALAEQFPELTIQDRGVLVRLILDGREAVDIIDPRKNTFYQQVFDHCIELSQLKIKIPDLEMALASKYAAMVSPNRGMAEKKIDAADFIRVVRNNQKVNREKIRGLVCELHERAGEEILKFIDDVQAGKDLVI